MKLLKKLSILCLILTLLLSMFSFSVSAASKAVLYFSSNTVTVGDSVTVTVTINPDKPIYAVSCDINYNENLLTFVSSDQATGGAGILKIVESPSGNNSVSYSMVFKAIATGTALIKAENCVYVSDDGNEVSFGGAAANLTVKDPALSNNANLKSLSISGVKFSPSFSSKRTSYTASVLYETTKVNVTAKVSDGGAKVTSVEGNNDLKVGKNNVVVTVQAADGTQKKYTITVTRLKEGEKLSDGGGEKETEPEIDTTILQTEIAGTAYTIATDMPDQALFKGFTKSTTLYNEIEVPIAVDEGGLYNLYYLKAADSEDLVPFTYNSELKSFERLKYILSGENVYIVEKLPSEYAIPENFYTSNLKIADFSVECLASNDASLSDMYYIYCYNGSDYEIYRYDSTENTIQRYPELKLQNFNDVVKKDNFFTRFASLSTNGKIIVIGLFIAVLGVLALIIVLAIYLINHHSKGKEEIILNSYYEQDDFDEVIIEDSIKTDTEE